MFRTHDHKTPATTAALASLLLSFANSYLASYFVDESTSSQSQYSVSRVTLACRSTATGTYYDVANGNNDNDDDEAHDGDDTDGSVTDSDETDNADYNNTSIFGSCELAASGDDDKRDNGVDWHIAKIVVDGADVDDVLPPFDLRVCRFTDTNYDNVANEGNVDDNDHGAATGNAANDKNPSFLSCHVSTIIPSKHDILMELLSHISHRLSDEDADDTENDTDNDDRNDDNNRIDATFTAWPSLDPLLFSLYCQFLHSATQSTTTSWSTALPIAPTWTP